MNIEIDVNGNKISIEAPHVRTTDEASIVIDLAIRALRDAQGDKPATPRPFGFNLSSDTERAPTGEVAEGDETEL